MFVFILREERDNHLRVEEDTDIVLIVSISSAV
jgi:hypothetical protein